VRNTLDSLGNAVSSIVPAVSATGRATTTMSYATQTPVTEKLPSPGLSRSLASEWRA
jgi:hypothetical protein